MRPTGSTTVRIQAIIAIALAGVAALVFLITRQSCCTTGPDRDVWLDPPKVESVGKPPAKAQLCTDKAAPAERLPCVAHTKESAAEACVASTLPRGNSPDLAAVRITVCGTEQVYSLRGREGGASSFASLNLNDCLKMDPSDCSSPDPSLAAKCRIQVEKVDVSDCPEPDGAPSTVTTRIERTFLPLSDVAEPAFAVSADPSVWQYDAEQVDALVGRGFRVSASSGGVTTELNVIFDAAHPVTRSFDLSSSNTLKVPLNVVWVDSSGRIDEPIGKDSLAHLRSLVEPSSAGPSPLSTDLDRIFAGVALKFASTKPVVRLSRDLVDWGREDDPPPTAQVCHDGPACTAQEQSDEPAKCMRKKIRKQLYRRIYELTTTTPNDPNLPPTDCSWCGEKATLIGYQQGHLNIYLVPWLTGAQAWAHVPVCDLGCPVPPSIFVSRAAFTSLEEPEIRTHLARVIGHEITHLSGMRHASWPKRCHRYGECDGQAEFQNPGSGFDPRLQEPITCDGQTVSRGQLTGDELRHAPMWRSLQSGLDCSSGSSMDQSMAYALGPGSHYRSLLKGNTLGWQTGCTACDPSQGDITLKTLGAVAEQTDISCDLLGDLDTSGPQTGATCPVKLEAFFDFTTHLTIDSLTTGTDTLYAASMAARRTSAATVRPMDFLNEPDGTVRTQAVVVEVLDGTTPTAGNAVLVLKGTTPASARLSWSAIAAYEPLNAGETLGTLLDTAPGGDARWQPITRSSLAAIAHVSSNRPVYALELPSSGGFPDLVNRHEVIGVLRF